MSQENIDTLIIGGGISGMYAAYLLLRKNIPFVILEARPRLGGRILSTEYQGYFSDLGPSWYWPEINPNLMNLIQILDLKGYRQFEHGMGRFQHPNGYVQSVRGYSMVPASWRVSGGMIAIITKLVETIPASAIRLNHPVCEIKKKSDGALVSVGELEKPWFRFHARKVILALPPRLAAATILFTPDLPHYLTQAMMRLGTWMAGQAKFCALYEEPYWRETGFSGQAFSQRGPLGEIHDGSSESPGPYGLMGFISIPAVQRDHEKSITKAILSQLGTIYGRSAAQPMTLYYQDWAREPFTATQYDQAPMHEHPAYQPPAGQTSIWDGIIQFSGSETANQCGGYLEGALVSAERAVMNRGF
ncbi:MAG: FAD-dependent oxidoreductase [Pseudomonadota bacterium]